LGGGEYEMNERQKRFVDEYLMCGNAEQAAIKAGYSKTYARGNAHKLVANVSIAEYIKEQQNELKPLKKATMEEVQAFWAETMFDENVERKDRLKASEYIAKTNAAFIEKQQIEANIGVTIVDDFDED
jgi:phage terminase small subunit